MDTHTKAAKLWTGTEQKLLRGEASNDFCSQRPCVYTFVIASGGGGAIKNTCKTNDRTAPYLRFGPITSCDVTVTNGINRTSGSLAQATTCAFVTALRQAPFFCQTQNNRENGLDIFPMRHET